MNEVNLVTRFDTSTCFRLVIAPHDDYAYASYMYPLVFSRIKAKTVIIFGVAHKTKGVIENKIVFDSFTHWAAPYGNIKESEMKQVIMDHLPSNMFVVNDSLQKNEHSVEAELPFLQYYRRDVEIIPILIPYMIPDTAEAIAVKLAAAIYRTLHHFGKSWGKDVAFLISNDAVHYGDMDWGGKNYAPYGSDTAAYLKAQDYDHMIIDECLKGNPQSEKILRFSSYTLMDNDYKSYKWTWCGRYSVPFGLFTGWYLQEFSAAPPLKGIELDYSTSISHPPIPVKDLKMGVTAPANLHHWVAYVSMGYL